VRDGELWKHELIFILILRRGDAIVSDADDKTKCGIIDERGVAVLWPRRVGQMVGSFSGALNLMKHPGRSVLCSRTKKKRGWDPVG